MHNFSSLHALKTAAIFTATAGFMACGLGAASAHVSVTPDSTSAGGFSQLTFRVPNESKTAKTSKVQVQLPTETPFTSVSVKPLDGWQAEVIRAKLPNPVTLDGATVTEAATAVVWTADAEHQLGENQYQTFSISVGRLPAEGTALSLPAIQTYTDGTVVSWDDPAAENGEEPEYPAPSFVTTAAASEHGHAEAETASNEEAAAGEAAGQSAAAEAAGTGDATARTIGWAGMGTGLLGLAAGGVALARTAGRRTSRD
jgi:periplasmic copper chaperone A